MRGSSPTRLPPTVVGTPDHGIRGIDMNVLLWRRWCPAFTEGLTFSAVHVRGIGGTDWSAHRGTADLVFVDADHSREAVLRDSRAALLMLRHGGMIVWHDFLYLDGVTTALAELAREMPIRHLAGTTLAVHRATT
jgi:predicted O-methyltransferase YrrM